LSPGERDLFWFLCCLEEPDRIRPVLDDTWEDLRHRLSRDGPPPELGPAIAAIAARGLVAVQREPENQTESCAVHPGVAAAGRAHAGRDFQEATDTGAAAYWRGTFDYASGKNDDGTTHTRLAVRAGLAAIPYLLRRQQWTYAARLLNNAFVLDPSRANAAALLPAIEQSTRHNPSQAIILARVLLVLDSAAGEALLRGILDDAVARGDHEAVCRAAGELVDLCRESGRLAEALTLSGQLAGHTRQAGLGPWTQLGDEVQRLQVLITMGQARQVLADVRRLRDRMGTLPDISDEHETVSAREVREILLDTGRDAALQLGQWQDALDLNAPLTASKRGRRAPAADLARTRFNDYFPLLSLGRAEEALRLLLECRQAFHDTGDINGLGLTLGALASFEDVRGHGDAAIRCQCDALRYKYLAAALIRTLADIGSTSSGGTNDSADDSAGQASTDLRLFGPAAEPPADVGDLCRKLGDIAGTDPAGLITRLSPDPETAERTLRDLITRVRALARKPAAGPEGKAR
jgi:hypothetical protein